MGSSANQCIYLRVLPVAISNKIEKCSAYLSNIEKQNEHNEFSPTLFTESDSLELIWSMRERDKRFDQTDIIKGVNRFVDVLATFQNTRDDRVYFQVRGEANWLLDICNEHGVYRLTIVVIAEDGTNSNMQILYSWNGKWDEIKAGTDINSMFGAFNV
jgi:hypothetical protein